MTGIEGAVSLRSGTVSFFSSVFQYSCLTAAIPEQSWGIGKSSQSEMSGSPGLASDRYGSFACPSETGAWDSCWIE